MKTASSVPGIHKKERNTMNRWKSMMRSGLLRMLLAVVLTMGFTLAVGCKEDRPTEEPSEMQEELEDVGDEMEEVGEEVGEAAEEAAEETRDAAEEATDKAEEHMDEVAN